MPSSDPDEAPNVPVNSGITVSSNDGPPLLDYAEEGGAVGITTIGTPTHSLTHRKRPMGVKSSKAVKKARLGDLSEDGAIDSTLDSWTNGFADASSALIETENFRTSMEREQAQRDYNLRK